MPAIPPRSFSGSVATTGNSSGLRIEKSFFKAAPEFATKGSKVHLDIIGPGRVLVSIDSPIPVDGDADPMIGAWLSFLEREPERLIPAGEAELAALVRLVAHVSADDNEAIPDDVTF